MSHYNVNRKPAVNPEGPWVNASYELTWAVGELTDREDLIVKIAPNAAYDDSAYDHDGNLIINPMTGEPAGHQHAAITFLETAVMEINPGLLPGKMNITDFHPLSQQNRKLYPVVWGAAAHEAAHANHSDWVLEFNQRLRDRKITAEERQWAGAALLLEESRIEKYQIDERPQDQPWLEAAGMHVAVEEYSEACKAAAQYRVEHPNVDEMKLSRYKCGRAAALTLARVDSGSVFRNTQIDSIEEIILQAFGNDYVKLRDIWVEAQDTADNDLDGMLALGRRWFALTQDDGDDSNPMGVAIETGGNPGGENNDGLGKALSEGAEQSGKEVSGEADEERRQARINSRRTAAQQEARNRRDAQDQASKTFGKGAGTGGYRQHPVTGLRKPTVQEVSLARQTRIRLQNAYIPEKTAIRVSQVIPPGRLSVRALQQRNAQRSAGMIPSAEPFSYTDRKHNTTPPLKVGIIQDVSGSQSGAAAAAVSGAWSLAKAANEIPDAKVAMVSFGDDVHNIIKPLTKVTDVPVISARAGTHYFLESLKAIEGELDLTRKGAARLVVILTDGQFNWADNDGRDAALKRLTGFGVKVLWVVTDGGGEEPARMPGLHVFRKASGNYSIIPGVICHEAVTALTK